MKSRCDGDTIDETIKNKKIISTFPDSHGNYRKIKQRKTKRKLSRTVEEEAEWWRQSWSLPMPAKITGRKEYDGKDITHNNHRRNRKNRNHAIRINNDGNITHRNDVIDGNIILHKNVNVDKDENNSNNNNNYDSSNDGIKRSSLHLSSDDPIRSKNILIMENEIPLPLSLPLLLPLPLSQCLSEPVSLFNKTNNLHDQLAVSPNSKTKKLTNMTDSTEISSINGNMKNRNRQTSSGDDENVLRDNGKEKVPYRWAQLENFSQSVGRLLPYQLSYLLQHVKSRESKMESEKRKKQSVMEKEKEKEIEKEIEKGRSNDSHASKSSHFNMSKKNSDYDSKNYSVNNQTDANGSNKNSDSQKHLYPPILSHGMQHGQQTPLSPAYSSEDLATWLKLDGVRYTILTGLNF